MAMIDPGYVRTMAAYNSGMNERIYAGCARLADDVRKSDQGAFFKSIHGTLNHLLWADQMWMSRFDGWDRPAVAARDSPAMIADFAALQAAREAADARIADWAGRVSADWLAGETVWFSGITQCQMRGSTAALVVHLFNHQTHHRGQVHALLTRDGVDPGDTDLWLVVR
jgi:uncharacterized damage-inducible protein DinB